MGCNKHFLWWRWERHAWDRKVTLTEGQFNRGTDMWSRRIPVDQVICHTQYVCRNCGAVRDGGDCTCDREIAEKCAVRLAYLAEESRDRAHAPA